MSTRIPYDIINVIFEYLSHITDSGWILNVNRSGKMRLLPRTHFIKNINNIHSFKLGVLGNQIHLNIQQWASIAMYSVASLIEEEGIQVFNKRENPKGSCRENEEQKIVCAIETPYRLYNQPKIDEDYKRGVVYTHRSYTYNDPETDQRMVAYIELRNRFTDSNLSFRQGCVYNQKGESFIITGYKLDEQTGAVNMVVNQFNMDCFIEYNFSGNQEAITEMMEAANILAELEEDEGVEEEIDFENLPSLQMYM